MNYFAHGYQFIDDPYFLAGTAVPDWLSVADRRVRVRAEMAAPLLADHDPRVAALAGGIVRHHDDDRWFHTTLAFYELSHEFTLAVRKFFPGDNGFRASFLGHILVELLLDSQLIKDNPGRLEAYYQAVDTVDAQVVQSAVNRVARHGTHQLTEWIDRFSRVRFLSDYAEDARLLYRLNQVMKRVGQSSLPAAFCQFLPGARQRVAERKGDLLTPPEVDTPERR